MTKPQFRSQILSLRETLAPDMRAEYSRRIAQTLISLPQFGAARTVHCYLSFGTEVETEYIRLAAFASGKRVAVPIHEKHNPILQHRFITDTHEFTPGHWNVPVPIIDNTVLLSAADLALTASDIIIVPLVAFDRSKHRLGYGKGFYDRFLHTEKAITIGIGFSIQEVEHIPIEPHDETLSMIITENTIY